LVEALKRGLTGLLMGLEAGVEHARDLHLKKLACGAERDEALAHQQEGPFLKTLVEFVEADFAPLRVPEITLKAGVGPVDQDSHDQLCEDRGAYREGQWAQTLIWQYNVIK
jgi:hypothetical protein